MVKGEYDIQGDRPKTSAKDVSYKSCLCALLIFIAICIIIILCGLNWSSKPKSQPIRETEEVEIFDKEKLINEETPVITTHKPWTTTRKLRTSTSKIPLPLTTKLPVPITTHPPTSHTHVPETKRPIINMTIITTTTTSKPQILITKAPLTDTTEALKPQTQTTSTSKPQISTTTSPVIVVNATLKSQTETPTNNETVTSAYTKKWVRLGSTLDSNGTTTTRKWKSIASTDASTTSKLFIQVRFKDNDVSKTTGLEGGFSSTQTTSVDDFTSESESTADASTADYSATDSYSSTTDYSPADDSATDYSPADDSATDYSTVNYSTTDYSSADYSTSDWYSSTNNDSTTDDWYGSGDYYSTSEMLSFAVDDGETTTDFTDSSNVLLRNIKASHDNQTDSHVIFITTTATAQNSTESTTVKTVLVKNYIVGSTTENANATVSQKVDTTTPHSKINVSTTTKSLPIPLDKTEPVCHTSGCKSAASRMLSLMNHSVDACEDFYEFSCGGMQADNADSDTRSRVSRLLNVVNSKSPVFLQKFKKFYDTCVSHEEEFNYEERLEAVKKIIDSVGTIDITESSVNIDITKLFAKLILYGSMPLMDVVLDLDKHSPKYILQLTLPQGRPASGEKERWSALLQTQRRCLDEERRRIYEPNLNLTDIHERYLTCNKNYTRYLNSLERTLEVLGYYSNFNESVAETKIRAVRFGVDFDILRILTEGPSTAEIRKTISDRDYTVKKVADLQRTYPLLKWKEFFGIISGRAVSDNDLVQVYFLTHFHYVLKELHSLPKWKLNNELLGIFALDLFENLVIPKYNHHRDKYCLHMSLELFHDVTSYWYLKSLSDAEITENESRINSIFKQLILNLTIALNSEEWLDDGSKISILQKAESLQVYFPDKRCKCLSDVNLSAKYDKLGLTDKYSHNLMVMKELRQMSSYYLAGELFDKEYTFCNFIYPFDKDPLSFYANHFIAVPFGLFKSVPKNLPDHVTIPRIGIYLAREIGRHFDPIGIYYKMALNEASNTIYNMSKDTTENMLSFSTTRNNTSQTLSFKPSGFLSINQRMAENTALRLMTDSYKSLISNNKKQLPWISTSYSKDEIYFIAIAQEYCQKTDTLEYMLKLLESDSLPASLRVENMMSNSNSFSTVFKCRDGATLNNVVDRIQFPYFPKFEYEDNYDINS